MLAELWEAVASANDRQIALEKLDREDDPNSPIENEETSTLTLLINRFRAALGYSGLPTTPRPIIAFATHEVEQELPNAQGIGELFSAGVKVEYLIEHYMNHSDLLIHAHQSLDMYVAAGERLFQALDQQNIVISLSEVNADCPLELFINDRLVKTFTVSL